MTAHDAGVVDTSIIAALRLFDPSELPDTILIMAVTLGELSYGPDLQIAATAASNLLPLYTANPADFQGTEGLVEIVSVKARPNNL